MKGRNNLHSASLLGHWMALPCSRRFTPRKVVTMVKGVAIWCLVFWCIYQHNRLIQTVNNRGKFVPTKTRLPTLLRLYSHKTIERKSLRSLHPKFRVCQGRSSRDQWEKPPVDLQETFQWQHVSSKHLTSSRRYQSDYYVFSAFYDERWIPAAVVIVGLASSYTRKTHQLYCRLWFRETNVSVTVNAHFRFVPETHGRKYATSFFTCPSSKQSRDDVRSPERRVPYAVSLVSGCQQFASNVLKVIDTTGVGGTREQSSSTGRDKAFQYTVCMSILHTNYSDYRQIVESIELNRLFGAERFVIYNMSSSSDVQLVLDSYSRDGFLDVIPWNSLPVSSRDENERGRTLAPMQVHYFGQLAALNDCLYRSMRHSTFLLTSDVDEIAVPRNTSGRTWNDMLESATLDWLHDRGHAKFIPGAYMLRQTFYHVKQPPTTANDNNNLNLSVWMTFSTKPKLQIDTLRRENFIYPYNIRSKYFVSCKTAVMLGIHYPFRSISSSVRTVPVDYRIGLLHHYRSNFRGKKRKLKRDAWIKRFSEDLVRRVTERRTALNESQSLKQRFNLAAFLRISYLWSR